MKINSINLGEQGLRDFGIYSSVIKMVFPTYN
jgi:hypothetical protein